jgi:hypothetical protein
MDLEQRKTAAAVFWGVLGALVAYGLLSSVLRLLVLGAMVLAQ